MSKDPIEAQKHRWIFVGVLLSMIVVVGVWMLQFKQSIPSVPAAAHSTPFEQELELGLREFGAMLDNAGAVLEEAQDRAVELAEEGVVESAPEEPAPLEAEAIEQLGEQLKEAQE